MDIFLIIDMQQAPFSQNDKYDSNAIISRINILSEHIRRSGGQVIFIQHDGTMEEGLFPETPGWQILSSLTQFETDMVIRKTSNDAFCKTKLHTYIDSICLDNIFVAGWATDFCVDTTIRAAISSGYNITVISDAHTLNDRPHLAAEKVIEHHNWVWENMITAGDPIRVVTLKNLLN